MPGLGPYKVCRLVRLAKLLTWLFKMFNISLRDAVNGIVKRLSPSMSRDRADSDLRRIAVPAGDLFLVWRKGWQQSSSAQTLPAPSMTRICVMLSTLSRVSKRA